MDAIYQMLGQKEVESLLDNTVEKRVNTVILFYFLKICYVLQLNHKINF